jgi:uncharacterized protein (TIGR02452 family)
MKDLPEGIPVKRSTRTEMARQTVEIVERGTYAATDGRTVDIGHAVRGCIEATRFLPPEELKRLRQRVLASPIPATSTVIEVVNETTLEGIHRLLAAGRGPVAALNFASAKNPGGGFLNGSLAQEESLARSSALYASLLQAPEYYQRHRASSSMLYSDAMILSPHCPIIRGDDGELLPEPEPATFITAAAPNVGAAANNRPEELDHIPDVLRRRSEGVLALAASEGFSSLVLGAWGCGVFRNDPAMVAAIFADHLKGLWAGRFRRIAFSVFDTSADHETFNAFRRTFEVG